MAIQRGPKIATSGLIFAVDAADTNSYPRAGTTWSDLRGRGYNGTLTNGPTFNSSNGGSIVFDGINDYVDFGTSAINQDLSNFSICFWIKPTAFPASGAAPISIFGKNDNGCGNAGARIFIRCNGTVSFGTPSTNCPGGAVQSQSGPLLTLNSWNFISFVYDASGTSGGVYLTGYKNLTSEIYIAGSLGTILATFSNNATLKIGYAGTATVYQGDFCGGSFIAPTYFAGNIACLLAYNKLLSASEIAQNYNASKNRFGL